MGMDDLLNDKERSLLQAYEDLGRKAPEWAYPFAPPIPFVGKGYGVDSRSKVLIYASAENLRYTKKFKDDGWLNPENQMIRSRVHHHERGATFVHMQPINNGSLLKAARHSLEQVWYQGSFSTDSPENFLDQVAVANPGKFSVNAESNIDYAGQRTPWLASKSFIEADLKILDPDIIIIPNTILRTLGKGPVGLSLTRPGRTIIPNYQITTRTINCTIKPKLSKPPANYLL